MFTYTEKPGSTLLALAIVCIIFAPIIWLYSKRRRDKAGQVVQVRPIGYTDRKVGVPVLGQDAGSDQSIQDRVPITLRTDPTAGFGTDDEPYDIKEALGKSSSYSFGAAGSRGDN